MTQVLDAIFEKGAFRPLKKPSPTISEGQKVRIVVEADSGDMLALAAKVYAGLSEQEIDEVERIALDRSTFFTQRETT
jgi:predicted DNA-binding antitoxin AbrB/MazE fold protein